MENFGKDLGDQIERDTKESIRNRFESRPGRVMAGFIVVTVGAVLLASKAGVEFPHWLFTWQMLVITIGLFIGAKHGFRGLGWLIPVVVGGVFMLEYMIPELTFHQYGWPVVLIIIGLIMIFRPRRRRYWGHDHRWESADKSTDDTIDSVSIFGGAKRIVISKDFKGGDVTTLFGGTDIDLTQADFNGTITIDITQIFGGTKLIVPAHWNIKSDVASIFGAVEDKRTPMKEPMDPSKVLKLDGTCVFGGIEIKNY